MRLEYVASGLSFLRLRFEETRRDPIMTQLNDMWTNAHGVGGHYISFLFNAFQEEIFAEPFGRCYRGKGIKQVYADSGGLQMVTQGMSITPELKAKVYDLQGRYSDVAMSFDEIPVTLVSDRAIRANTSNKFFDKDKFEFCARESGRNVRDQILHFNKLGSDAKPMFIAQGSDLDTYAKWTELALEEIPKELHSQIGGIAMGAAALGNGMLEDIKRAFYFTQLPTDLKHLHLLGVGSLTRLLPTITFLQSGVYSDDLYISYDSTTHTSGVEMGRYHINGDWITPSRYMNHLWHVIHEDIAKNVPQFSYDLDTFHRGMNTSVRRHEKSHGTVEEPILAYNAYFTASLMNFLREVEAVLNSKERVLKLLGSPLEQAAFDALSKVKTRSDFEKWVHEAGRCIPSIPIKNEAPGESLEDLFA